MNSFVKFMKYPNPNPNRRISITKMDFGSIKNCDFKRFGFGFGFGFSLSERLYGSGPEHVKIDRHETGVVRSPDIRGHVLLRIGQAGTGLSIIQTSGLTLKYREA